MNKTEAYSDAPITDVELATRGVVRAANSFALDQSVSKRDEFVAEMYHAIEVLRT
jgi:hypothetical protein